MASLSAQLSSSIKIHIYTGKYVREHVGVKKGCAYLCVCYCKMNHEDGWAQASFSQSCLWGHPDLPGLFGWWCACFTDYFYHMKVTLCNSSQGRWCWTSKEYLWSGRTLVPLGPSLCSMCCSMLPRVPFRPLKGDSSNLSSTSPQTAAQKQHHKSTVAPCSTHRTLMCYDTRTPSSSPTFCSCMASGHNCLFFWGAGKHYHFPVWLLSIGCHQPTKTLKASVWSADCFNGKSVL